MRKKFSTLVLTGKAATLPFLMQQAHALTPAYTDILTSEFTQVEMPVANQVRLDGLGSSTYNGSATLCSDTTVASQLSVVITGLQDKDRLFLATATSLGTGNQSLDSRIRLGTTKLLVPVNMTVGAPGSGSVAVTVPLDLNQLRDQGYDLNRGGKFYLQSIVFPAAAMANGLFNWSLAKVSEVDEISVANCSAYGGTTY